MKTIFALTLALLIPLNAMAPEPPKPPSKDLLFLLGCIATVIVAAEAAYIVIKTINSCTNSPGPLSIDNPTATLHCQQSSNLVNWQTFHITNAPVYDCLVTNWNPCKPTCYMRVVAYP